MSEEEIIKKAEYIIKNGKAYQGSITEYFVELYYLFNKEKEKNKELENTLKQTQNNWFEDTNLIEKQQKEIEELKITNKELTERVLRLESDKFWNNVVSKDKIKAKIEEIKEEIKTCYIYKKTGRCTNNCKETCIFYYDVIDILQSLLEELLENN